MADVFDILLDADLELKFTDGDFAIGESTEQHQQLLLMAEKGSFAATPLVGVGVRTWLNEDAGKDELKGAIQLELEADGMTVEKLEVNTIEDLKIQAGYE